jgi:hypothetical protein
MRLLPWLCGFTIFIGKNNTGKWRQTCRSAGVIPNWLKSFISWL